MPKRKTSKSASVGEKDNDAQAARERELQDLIERAENKKNSDAPSPGESYHDFVERHMRDNPKK
jgi:hypothetical protein